MRKLLVFCAIAMMAAGCAVFTGGHKGGDRAENRRATGQRVNRQGMSERRSSRQERARNVDGMTERVNETLKSRNYTVMVDLMTTANGHNRALTHPWNIEVSGDKLHSYLPYVGEVYLPSVSTGEGLNFNADIEGYSQSTNRKGATVIKFWARSGEDRYEYALTVYPGGAATLRVMPDRKSAVTFDGRLDLGK